jgi:hypothetical protein
MADLRTQDTNITVYGSIAGMGILAVFPAAHNVVSQLMGITLNGETLNTAQDITLVTEDRTIGDGTMTVVTKVQVNGTVVPADGMTLVIHYANMVEL